MNLPALTPTSAAPLQPVTDVPAHLRTRAAVAAPEAEPALFATLPRTVAAEVRALGRAFALVAHERKLGRSVSAACRAVLPQFAMWGWTLKTFRDKYDRWLAARDWVVLVNRSKAGGAWQQREAGLPEAFLTHVAAMFARYKRADGKRQALLAIHRHWRTGRDAQGAACPVPGYETGWDERCAEVLPAGWSYANVLRQIKARGKFTAAIRALSHEGESAARAFTPLVRATRAELRFLEEVQFDDVKTDWRVFDTGTGEPLDLWLLVARDLATSVLLGFGMRPARVREDGTQEHLKLQDMKQLLGWLLERWGLPPYQSTWKLERGTATIAAGTAAAVGELFGDRIRVSYSSMIGRTSPVGYAESAKGNSRGKASLESHNRLIHTMGAFLPGQTGNRYDVRPADLKAREAEAREIWRLAQYLGESLRGQQEFPLLTLAQAREQLFRIFTWQNQRTEHELEGFAELLEWFDGTQWQPQATYPGGDVPIRRRKEAPLERAGRLVAGLEWSRVSPDIIAAFYEHLQREVRVSEAGEITFRHEGAELVFASQRGSGAPALVPGTKLLAYFHPDDPRWLTLTNGKGGIVGVWQRRDRIRIHDSDALASEIRRTTAVLNAAKAAAAELAAPERAELEALRARNAERMQFADFTDVSAAPGASVRPTVTNGVAAGLTALQASVKAEAAQQNERRASLRRLSADAAAELAATPEPEFEAGSEISAAGLL